MIDLSPAFVMAVWTAGIATGAATVAYWRIVGPGYVWLAAGTVAGFGIFAAIVDAGPLSWIGVFAAILAIATARRAMWAAGALGGAAVAFLAVGFDASPWFSVVSGSVLIGGITSEMLLGHWYLVDPKLPRWALFALVGAGGMGLVADSAVIGFRIATDGLQADSAFGWAYVALVLMTALLLVGVWFSLKEPRYTGVMAATGLSYLAVLTGLGVLVIGRIVGFET